MKIGFDLDDILMDFIGALILFHNEIYGSCVQRRDFKSYRFCDAWGGTIEEAIRKVSEFYDTPFFENMLPVEGSVEGVGRLKAQGDELFIVTSRPEHLVREKTTCGINRHFPGIFSGIHFSKNRFTGFGDREKVDICKGLGIEVFCEDTWEYAVQCAGAGIQTYLLDAPWNQEQKGHEQQQGLVRIYSFAEMMREIERYRIR